MRGRVMNISTVSHQLMQNGKKCDKWTATITVRVSRSWMTLKCFYIVTGRTKKAVQDKLDNYELWQDYDFESDKLIRARI